MKLDNFELKSWTEIETLKQKMKEEIIK